MKKFIAVLAICLMLTGVSFADWQAGFMKPETTSDAFLTYYSLCVSVLSLICLVDSNASDNLKTFTTANAMVAGGYVFYKFNTASNPEPKITEKKTNTLRFNRHKFNKR